MALGVTKEHFQVLSKLKVPLLKLPKLKIPLWVFLSTAEAVHRQLENTSSRIQELRSSSPLRVWNPQVVKPIKTKSTDTESEPIIIA